MPKAPRARAPKARKVDVVADRAASHAVIAKPTDPRQAGLFDKPLPLWIRPCLPTLVDKPPVLRLAKLTP